MSVFGYDKQVVDRAMAEGSRIMTQQQLELQEMARNTREWYEAYEREKASNSRAKQRIKELEESLQRKQNEADSYRRRAEQAEGLAERFEEERDQAREDRDQRLRELGDVHSSVARLERRVHELEAENEKLYDRVARAEFALDDERERHSELKTKLAAAEGVIEGFMLRPPSEISEATRTARQGQAALMRGRKRSLSPQARLEAFEQAKAMLGDLPDDARQELRRLRAELKGGKEPDTGSSEQ